MAGHPGGTVGKVRAGRGGIAPLFWLATVLLIPLPEAAGRSASPPPYSDERVLRRCAELVEQGRHDEACAALVKLRPKVAEKLRPSVDALLARACLAKKEPDRALRCVAAYAEKRDRYDPGLWACYDAAARAHLALGESLEAVLLYDWLAQRAAGEQQALAAEGCGDALMVRREYAKAIAAYTFAIRCVGALRSQANPGACAGLLERLQAALRQAERLRDIDLYGEDYVLYRDAERLRQGAPEKALPVYAELVRRFPQSVYAEAAGVYSPYCLVEVGRTVQAEQALEAFWRRDKSGLYRGEALLTLGCIALERRLEPDAAKKWFDLLARWLADVPAEEKPLEKLHITAAAREVSKPPPQEKTVDFWGNVKRAAIQPGQLVNRRTCSWYLDDLHEQCAAFRGFLFFVQGERERAAKCYEAMLEHGSQTQTSGKAGLSSNYDRLRWGADHGYLYAYPQELALYRGRQRLAVLLGDFYYCTEDFAKAAEMATRLLDGQFGALSGPQCDYPQYLLASARYWAGGKKEAFLAYEKVLERRDGTLTEARATFAAGNIATEIRDPEIARRGAQLLRALALSGGHNEFAYKAMIVYARSLATQGSKREAVRVLREVPEAAGSYWHLAQLYLQEYKGEPQGGR